MLNHFPFHILNPQLNCYIFCSLDPSHFSQQQKQRITNKKVKLHYYSVILDFANSYSFDVPVLVQVFGMVGYATWSWLLLNYLGTQTLLSTLNV